MSKKSKEVQARDSYLTYLTVRVVAVFFIFALVAGVGYYFGSKNSTEKREEPRISENIDKKKVTKKDETQEIKNYTTTIPELTKRLQSVLKQDAPIENLTPSNSLKLPPKLDLIQEDEKNRTKKTEVLKALKSEEIYKVKTANHEYKDTKVPTKPVRRKIEKRGGKAKLAIIIDDVSFSRDVKAIKRLNIPITMSFLPPTAWHPNSALLASKEKFYMVHLPLEAQRFNAAEPETLKITDTQQDIDEQVKKIVKMFPNVKYINNHTGSKFTSNERSMNRLILSLNSHGIEFVDSRTTGKSKVQKVMKNYNKRYLARDIFLDHHTDKQYVKRQIRAAIKVAKLHGTAIAIGHPRKETLQALLESKEALKEIELVRIDRLY